MFEKRKVIFCRSYNILAIAILINIFLLGPILSALRQLEVNGADNLFHLILSFLANSVSGLTNIEFFIVGIGMFLAYIVMRNYSGMGIRYAFIVFVTGTVFFEIGRLLIKTSEILIHFTNYRFSDINYSTFTITLVAIYAVILGQFIIAGRFFPIAYTTFSEMFGYGERNLAIIKENREKRKNKKDL